MRDLFPSRARTSTSFAVSRRDSLPQYSTRALRQQPTNQQRRSLRTRQSRRGHIGDNRSLQSNSRQSTATMTDFLSVASSPTVPTYVVRARRGNSSSIARFMEDDSSWVSGMESHTRSLGGVSSTLTYSSAGNTPTSFFLRDGKATKRVIDDLSKAEDAETRQTALCVLCVEFDHNDIIKHNAELYYGAAAVLSKHLSMTDNHDEIRMICAALELSFRGGSKYVVEAFHINGPTMIPLLLRLLDRCEQSKMQYADDIILSISKVFHYISRISDLRVSMTRQQGMLDCMSRVACTPLNVACRNVRVRTIVNLANCHDNKVLLFAHKGLLNSLLKIAQLDLCDDTREYAAMALMDLASATPNQAPLASNGEVLRTLTRMVVAEENTAIRECAITTLQNLAFPKSNRKWLVEFQNGVVLDALLSVLLNYKSIKGRRRAGGALTNLAYNATAESMGQHPDLLSTLATVAAKDESKDVQSRACLALTKIATCIDSKSNCYRRVLTALVVASKSTATDNSISAVLRCKARESENRESLARHPGLLEALADMCCDLGATTKTLDNATRTIMHLANENVNRKIMCNTKMLNALIRGSSFALGGDQLDPIVSEIQDSAIRAIARLATESSNRAVMAKHGGLLTAVTKAIERELKLEDECLKRGEQSQPFLGKPLLMSLLMAM